MCVLGKRFDWKVDYNHIELPKTKSMVMIPATNASWATLDASSGIPDGVGNLSRSDIDELALGGDTSWNATKINEYWQGKETDGGDSPLVKFGPELLLVVVALLLAIGVACRCVAGKIRVTLNRRRGAEVAFELGATDNLVDRVVAAEVGGRWCNGDGNRPGNTHGFTI